ncbi:hypothetical protein ACIQWN_22950 [Streptomyces vinaceus]|uniref:hypothetical protein n=1 Tax=Streptomyces vinaceus TaxID=1960 RepID=UPI003814A9C2
MGSTRQYGGGAWRERIRRGRLRRSGGRRGRTAAAGVPLRAARAAAARDPYARPVPPQQYPYAWAHPPVPPPGVEPSRGRKILRGLYNPFYAAQRAFRPSRPGIVHDPEVRKLQLWRTVLGLVAWVGLMVAY